MTRNVKTYKHWTIVTLLTFLGLMVLLVLTDLTLTLALPLSQAVFDDDFEEKVQSLLLREDSNDVDVIICGDSRAERQLIPAVVEKETGLTAVNVATKGLDLISIANCFEKYGILSKMNAVLLISVSIFEVNDGAVGEGYTSAPCIFNLKWTDQIRLFKKHLPYLINKKIEYYTEYFRSRTKTADKAGKEFAEKGYVGVEGTLRLVDGKLDMDLTEVRHPWYKDFTFPGKKWEVFQRALKEIASHGDRVYIFLPPGAPVWVKLTENTAFDTDEREFADLLAHEAEKYGNVFFLDFYTKGREGFTNEMFYDLQHLNRTGSEYFTEILTQTVFNTLKTQQNAKVSP